MDVTAYVESEEVMTCPIEIEEAREGEKLVGWRISVPGDVMLVWADQAGIPGFRCGRNFIPSLGNSITYRPLTPDGEQT
jgi:hypothetical protein